MARLNVGQPTFFRDLDVQLKSSSLNDLKAYLRWHLVHAKARFLSSAFVEADFNFLSKLSARRHRHAAPLEAMRATRRSHSR